jgi:two-component system response regulator NreC
MSIRILLADDHSIMRQGVAALLEAEPDLLVVGQASTGREAVALARELRPNVVVMDITIPELSGIDATRQICEQVPRCRVLALSMHNDREYVLELLRAGGMGYLLKGEGFAELTRAVRTVAAGSSYLSPDLADVVVQQLLSPSDVDSRSLYTELSEREREVIQLVVEGHTSKEIGAMLHISSKTVESHRSRAMGKLGVENIVQLVKLAIREGVTSP